MQIENTVEVLFTGYSHSDFENPRVMRANSTCTLIRTVRNKHIIVDTMTAWDGPRLVEALANNNLEPKDINVVVCTHGHADHIGCNHLFTQAQWHFVGACVCHRDRFFDWGTHKCKPFQLDRNDVEVICTPGHTLDSVSVVVRDTQLGSSVGIVGDLFERAHDITDESIWLTAGSEDEYAQRIQRLRMAELCTFIIPGHGPGFPVTPDIVEQLRSQLQRYNASRQKAFDQKKAFEDGPHGQAHGNAPTH